MCNLEERTDQETQCSGNLHIDQAWWLTSVIPGLLLRGRRVEF